uniref:EGF-like domain-containing protein n=1 Tax=Lates calcarifer TaxID=8187 RepID=A0A4W6CM04_LATCA
TVGGFYKWELCSALSLQGYRLARGRKSCVDVDECEERKDLCTGENRECMNTEGGFECTCKDGFVEDDGVCVNNAIYPTKCNVHCMGPQCDHMCENLFGSYRCICHEGFELHQNRCVRAPWNCEILEGGCEHKCVENPKEAPSCYCPAGQSVNPANNVTCDVVPDDPCAALGCEHACYKDGDSHVCICDHGFKLAADGRSCVDFNDCTDQRQCPGENFRCINTVGGFQCVCKEGYSLSGSLCVDQDECASAPCEHMCDNTPGSYKCSCYDGHIVDPKDEGAFCIDIDECSFFYCDQGCVNTFGSYVCSCNPGFTLVGEYRCVKDDKGTVTDGGMGGKTAATTPDIPTTPSIPPPDPTRQPSGVTVGGLVGIIVCTVFFIVLIVFLAHHFLNRGGKMESAGALKAHEDEGHSLHRVTSDTS